MQNSHIIILNKPKGISSFKFIRDIQRKYGYNKIGHAGTLDPMAQGMMIAMSNKATKLSDLLMKKNKIYSVVMELGYETDTLDTEGKVIKTMPYSNISEEYIAEILKKFEGEIEQIPPMYSAIKLNGKKLYNLARKDIKLDIKPRKVTIEYITDLCVEDNKISFKTLVSSGTYIRSLVRDIAYELGTCATMIYLKREQIADIKLKKDILILNVEDVIKLDTVNITLDEKKKLINGMTILKDLKCKSAHCYYKNQYLGIINIEDNKIKKSKFFITESEDNYEEN